MAFEPLRSLFARSAREDASRAPLAGDRRESIRRLQVGFAGMAAMVLIVGLANIIMDSVQESQATAVPEAAPTVIAIETPEPAARDPLADAGVVPDLPAEPAAVNDAGAAGGALPSAPPASGNGAPPPAQ